ncbi:rod shape-determining protein [Oscillospiraceae bacterium LTW-04]|nr:rod shape-determining protein [Oscillospiraceae bacterium MB24-C1]
MTSNDIGIDLGTATVIIYDMQKGLLLKEPSVVAVDSRSGDIIAAGDEAYRMLGRTPDRIRAAMPLVDGVISDFDMTKAMISHFIHKIYPNNLIKPRVVICVPSGVTEVEANAVVSAALSSGARKVYLIEEPVAAAIGAGIDIAKPEGNIILDIGGGTSDIAVLSLNGVVCKTSVRMAGRKFDETIVKYVRRNFGLLIGERMAERAKLACGSVSFTPEEDCEIVIKGRNLSTGLPGQMTITRGQLCEALSECMELIISAVRRILENTPPELAADIYRNGLTLTGGGALLHGIDRLLTESTHLEVHVAENPTECVAKGTAAAFVVVDSLADGFMKSATYLH